MYFESRVEIERGRVKAIGYPGLHLLRQALENMKMYPYVKKHALGVMDHLELDLRNILSRGGAINCRGSRIVTDFKALNLPKDMESELRQGDFTHGMDTIGRYSISTLHNKGWKSSDFNHLSGLDKILIVAKDADVILANTLKSNGMSLEEFLQQTGTVTSGGGSINVENLNSLMGALKTHGRIFRVSRIITIKDILSQSLFDIVKEKGRN